MGEATIPKAGWTSLIGEAVIAGASWFLGYELARTDSYFSSFEEDDTNWLEGAFYAGTFSILGNGFCDFLFEGWLKNEKVVSC